MKITSIINIVAIILMSLLFFPVFHMNVNTKFIIGFNAIKMQYILVVLHGLIFARKSNVFVAKPMIGIYICYLTYYLFRISGYYDTQSQWFGMFLFPVYLSTLIYTYYTSSNDKEGFARVIFSALVFIVLSAGLNAYQIFKYPDAARGVSGMLTAQGFEALSQYYTKIGVADYAFVSSLSYIVPLLVYQLKITRNRSHKILIGCSIATICYSMFQSAISAPILIGAVGLVLAYLGRHNSRKSIAIVFMVFMMILVTPKPFLASVFYSAADIMPNKSVGSRFHDIGISIEEGIDTSSPTNEVEFRAERIPRNIEAFLTNPIFGTGYEENAHLFWLNMLAQFGLIGTLPLILIIYSQVKTSLKTFSDEYKYYYMLSVTLFILLGLMKAITGLMFYFALLVLPGVFYLRFLPITKLSVAE